MYRCPIAHITTVHPRHDTRIRVKEVAALAERFGAVALVVQDGKGDASESDGRVRVCDVGKPGNRSVRAMRGSWRMWKALRRLRPRLVHFHDPELIPLAILLKLAGFRVIYDVHEDVPRQVMDKDWIPVLLRWPAARVMAALEWLAARSLDAIVAAVPVAAKRFPPHRTVIVQNFPRLEEFLGAGQPAYGEREPLAVYVGGITALRGAHEMVAAISALSEPARLALGGRYSPARLRDTLMRHEGWSRVSDMGWLSRDAVVDLLGRARVGLVVLHPIGNYLDAYPVKMFEYMAAGLPVIASDFPLWRSIVEDADCGLLVPPQDPDALAGALDWIMSHPAEAEAMGRRGRKAVLEKYNWNNEAGRLLDCYRGLGLE